MARIVSVVLNSVKRDIRVIKQAESLQKAGHQVIIVGLRDKNVTAAHEVLESGIEIYRPRWRADTQARLTSYTMAMAALAVGATILLLWALAALASALMALDWDTLAQALSGGFSPQKAALFAGAAIVAGVALFMLNKVRRGKRSTKGFASAEDYEELKAIVNPGIIDIEPLKPTRRNRMVFSLLSWPLDFGEHNRIVRIILREQAFARFIERLKPEIIHCHDLFTLPIGVTVKEKTGCKLVFDAHEMYDQLAQTGTKEATFNRHCLRQFGPMVDKFVTVNDSIAAYYANIMPFLPKAVVVKNATVIAPAFEYDGRLHTAAGVPSGKKILLYQGGFSKKRGLDVLVESARLLDPSWVIVMMGWGNYERDLRRLAYGKVGESPFLAGRACQIRFIPPAPQEELPMWTAGATVGVIPYEDAGLNHWFCSPNKLWEYPNAGVPVLVNPFPELKRTVKGEGEGNEIGWMLPGELTPQAIAETVNALTDEEISLAKHNCAGYIARDNWDVYGARLVALYEEFGSIGRQQ